MAVLQKSYRHNVVKLFGDAKDVAGDLLIDSFTRPTNFPNDFWKNETVEEYLERLHNNGNADNRYQIYGHSRYFDEIFKLDQLVFSARRLCRHLGT
jgi:hypothetical protein